MEKLIPARVVLLLTMMVCVPSGAFARDKTDVLIMKNGDRITCEVKRLEGNVVEVGLDYVDGSISIDWEKVARIESSYLFLVQLTDGSTFAGKVIKPETVGKAVSLSIQEVGAETPVEVPQDDVVRMTQTDVSWLRRFNGGLTLGSLYSKANTTAQYNISSDLGYEETLWSAKVRYSSNLSSSSGADTATRNQIDLSGYRLLKRYTNVFVAGNTGYLQSSVQGIESQVAFGGGLGKFLKNTGTKNLTLLIGLGLQQTHYVPSATTQQDQSIGVAVISSNLEIFHFKKTHLTATANVLPALNDPGRVFAKTNASYYLKLFGKFDWNFSFYGNWDTRPPATLTGSDYGTSTGFSYTFGNR